MDPNDYVQRFRKLRGGMKTLESTATTTLKMTAMRKVSTKETRQRFRGSSALATVAGIEFPLVSLFMDRRDAVVEISMLLLYQRALMSAPEVACISLRRAGSSAATLMYLIAVVRET